MVEEGGGGESDGAADKETSRVGGPVGRLEH